MNVIPLQVRNAPSGTSVMVEALREVGYSTAAVIADIINNSIAAYTTENDLRLDWGGSCRAHPRIPRDKKTDETGLDTSVRPGRLYRQEFANVAFRAFEAGDRFHAVTSKGKTGNPVRSLLHECRSY